MSLWAILRKDLLREARSRESLQASLVLVLLFSAAFLFTHPRLDADPAAAALLLWLPVLYGGTSAAGRTFALETDAGVLPLLRQAPVPVGWHGIARTMLQAVLGAALALFVLLVAAVGWSVPGAAPTAVVLLLAAIGVAIIGTLAGALASQARVRDLLLPVLAVPILIPLLQAGIPATMDALSGASWSELRPALLGLAGYDVAAAGAAWLLWPHVLEAD